MASQTNTQINLQPNAQASLDKKPKIDHANPLARTLLEKLDYDQLTNCMRCGFCLPACPTFRETGVEPESPRGRIALMKAVVDGLMEPDGMFRDQMNHCLGCRACEPVCPADVKYGQLIEKARDAIEDHPNHSLPVKGMRKLFFNGIFPHRNRLKVLGGAMKFYQKSGLRRVARGTGMMKLFPRHLQQMESILPDAGAHGVVEKLGTVYPAKGTPIARVALFRGCIMDVMFAETNCNSVKLLSEAGFEVVIPPEQVCCGALHAHSGEMELARDLARTNVKVFKEMNVDYIVSNAGGCGALLIEYDHLLHEDAVWKEQASWFESRVVDISKLLLEHGRLPSFAESSASVHEPIVVTYQDSCHLRNVMRNGAAPRQLIRQVGNVIFEEMKEADRCCGSAGIYNVTHPEMAGQILEHKMENVNATGARYLLTSNPGCLLQMKLGVEKHGNTDKMEVQHVVDFLYERLI
ncbi:(Fe-S)-binding protein [Paenibacillus sp. ISL-20]|uniref:(Fe-S)-binding protein n=1 Tax=Paenibacillus sp. ISL-20 TaxID=2819163 RepID=UPI001BE6F80D|nr:(Fe-S)-binding protein [Paenibacillus sp. ISL-20]MBT2766023.1 (Fe-S)-binding protein [Paenibacillus sp. ISL-20]